MPASPLLIDEDALGTNAIGKALFAGRLVATLQSKKSGEHVTVQFKAMAKVAGKWRTEPMNLASHVFIDIPNSGEDGFNDKVGTVYPPHSPTRWAGHFFEDPNADHARAWAARKVLDIAQGKAPVDSDLYELELASHCLRCGRELTEPESITALMGPKCRGIVSAEYGRRHQAKARAAATPPPPDPGEEITSLPITIEPGTDLAELVGLWSQS